MNVWKRERIPDGKANAGALFVGSDRYDFSCVGESTTQEALAFMMSMAGPEFPVQLVCEPPNEHHEGLAIAVHSMFGALLAYFPHEDAERHADELVKALDWGAVICDAKLIGGPEKGEGYSYGLVLDFDDDGWQRSAGHMNGTSRKAPRPVRS